MGSIRRAAFGTAAIAVAGLAFSCDDTPERGSRSPLSPSTGTVRVVITGPDSVAPDGTAQYTATAQQADGSTRDVTGEALWRSTDDSVLSLASNGLATARSRGEVSISAAADGFSAAKGGVMVIPPATFRLMGTVRDQGVPVPGAEVAIVGGEGTGLTTRTAEDGSYRLYGAAGEVEIRASRTGYAASAKRVQVTSHETVDFDLATDGSLPTLSGSYSLTIQAAGTCTALPDEARVRTYRAHVIQKGLQVTVTLEGAEFLQQGTSLLNTFRGTVESDRVRFTLYFDPWGSYWPDLVERLVTASSEYLVIHGTATITSTGSTYTGLLDGTIETWNTRYASVASCRSSEHRFALVP